MPSNRPKLQGYVDAEIHKAFADWKIERGIEGDSHALTELLKQFFGFEKPTGAGLSREQIEEIVEAKIQAAGEAISESLKVYLDRLEAVEAAVKPIEGLAEISPWESPDNLPEDSRWKIGDRILVLCKSNYQGMPGTIIDFDKRLGWHVAVDRWWEAVGIAESVIDPREKRAGNIWCDPKDMELLLEITDNPPQSEEPKKPPLTIPLTGLKQSELEQRLKLAKGILTRRRDKADFKEWSQRHDPQGIAWQWDAIAKKYLAVE